MGSYSKPLARSHGQRDQELLELVDQKEDPQAEQSSSNCNPIRLRPRSTRLQHRRPIRRHSPPQPTEAICGRSHLPSSTLPSLHVRRKRRRQRVSHRQIQGGVCAGGDDPNFRPLEPYPSARPSDASLPRLHRVHGVQLPAAVGGRHGRHGAVLRGGRRRGEQASIREAGAKRMGGLTAVLEPSDMGPSRRYKSWW